MTDNNSHNQTILVIEDDKFLGDVLVERLSKEKFNIKISIDGNDAMKQIETLKPDLILLDLLLPGIDGFEILGKIKNDAELSKIPVIVLSNFGQQEDIDRAKSLGAREYLIKAYSTPSEITKKIEEVLNIKP